MNETTGHDTTKAPKFEPGDAVVVNESRPDYIRRTGVIDRVLDARFDAVYSHAYIVRDSFGWQVCVPEEFVRLVR